MRKTRVVLTILASACTVALAGTIGEQVLAAQKKPHEQVSSAASAKPSKLLPEPALKPASLQGKKPASPVMSERLPEAVQQQAKQALAVVKPTIQKGRRHVKVHTKHVPKAVLQPTQDLTHYGLLEDSQRYDPRPNHRAAGVQNPQTPDLTYDHFQELDRNQDGKIDPVERVFGRLDMDRDLHDRHLQ